MERKRERFSCSKYGVRVVSLDNEELLLNALQLTLQMDWKADSNVIKERDLCQDNTKRKRAFSATKYGHRDMLECKMARRAPND